MSDTRAIKVRFMIFRAMTVMAFVIIGLKLWNLQVVSSESYQDSADRNRFRLLPIDAPRGIIYDRFGQRLVRNVPSFTVSIVPAGLPDDALQREQVLVRLAELLGINQGPDQTEPSSAAIETLLQERMIGVYSPVRIASNVDRQAAFIIEEEHLHLPGVIVSAAPLRHYEDGPLMAHLLGYVGNIPSHQVDGYVAQDYLPDDQVGLIGIENTQEQYLRGVKGQKHIEVDAFEREVAIIASEPAIQGQSIYLTVDLELQRVTEQALREGMRVSKAQVGVAIVMDPRTGEVLAMVSLPSYDNNLFSGGISYQDYAALSSDRHHPLVNHAISGQYPPGSTFKIIPAVAALQEQVVDEKTRITCQGTMLLPNKIYPDDLSKAQAFYCWNKAGHGPVSVVSAVAQSCDIYFYQVSGGYYSIKGLDIERLADYAHMFGMGETTGIELSGEASGLLPSDRWKRQYYSESWYTGDTYNAAIGQGYILSTPLQLLNATAVIANHGTLYRPQIVYQVIDAQGELVHALEPEVIRRLDVDAHYVDLVRQGMREAVTVGTAWNARIPGVAVAGKTGTAEYPGVDENGNLILDKDGNLPTHAWFTAFAPFDDPEIVLVVFLEGGGEGSQVSAPVAAEIMRYYFAVPASRKVDVVGTRIGD